MNMHDYIDEYMAGLLKGDQLVKFELALQSDQELKKLVDNYDDLKHVAEGLMELQLLEEVERASTEIQCETPRKKKNINYFYLLLAAAAVATLVYFLSLHRNSNSPSVPMAFKDMYREPIWPVTRQGDEDYLNKAASQYLEGDFTKAKELLLDSVENQTLARYWLAEMYMQREEFDSVSVYLPEANELSNKSNRIRTLKEWLLDLKK